MWKVKTNWIANYCKYTPLLAIGITISLTSFKLNNQVDTNAKIKSLFIYNFTKYIEWPVEKEQGNFVIGVIGDYPTLIQELKTMAETRKKGSQTIEISILDGAQDINDCHILFVESGKSNQLPEVINKIKGKNILLVADGLGLAKKGAGISFYDSESRQKMEINPQNVQKYQLKISSQLIALATVVE